MKISIMMMANNETHKLGVLRKEIREIRDYERWLVNRHLVVDPGNVKVYLYPSKGPIERLALCDVPFGLHEDIRIR